MSVIETEALTKTFIRHERVGLLRRTRREVTAVGGLDLRIEAGTIVGFIGPNGAGKSTTIKMLTGILLPTSGRVRVTGVDPQRHRRDLARRIGVVFGQRTQLWWDLPLRESFELLHHVYGTIPARHRANLEELVDLLEVGPTLSTPVRQLSLGQRMRGELIAALLHDPDLLFLDEPTIGLDIVSKAAVREFLVRRNADRDVTVVLTTHDLADVERLCQRVIVIDHGRLLRDGTVADIRSSLGGRRQVVVDLHTAGPRLEFALAGVTTERVDGPRQWVSIPPWGASAADVIAAIASQASIRDLTVVEPDIEDAVARLYAGPESVH